MNCNRFEDDLVLYAFGELEPSKKLGVEQHLQDCSSCRNSANAYAFAREGIKDLPEAPEPSLSVERLRQAILSQELKSRPNWGLRLGILGAAAASFTAALIAINNSSNPGTENLMTKATNPNVVAPPPHSESIAQKVPTYDDLPDFPDFGNDTQSAVAPKAAHRHTSRRSSARIASAATQKPTTTYASRPVTNSAETAGAIAAGGAASASEVFADSMPAESLNNGSKDVIVIRPGRGGASEVRAPDVVSIGG